MEYLIYDYDNLPHKFSFSYRELKEDYLEIKEYSDEEFLENLPDILHTTVFICWLKEIPTSVCLSDYGVIHEITHLLTKTESPFNSLDKIREIWNNQCRL